MVRKRVTLPTEIIIKMIHSIVVEYIDDECGGEPPLYLRTTYLYNWADENDKMPKKWSKTICKSMITKYVTPETGYILFEVNSRGSVFKRVD